MQGSRFISMLVLLLTISLVFAVTLRNTARAEVADHIVISEIQADSISGAGGTDDDWIELYNPTGQPIDLEAGNYRIEKTLTSTSPDIVIRIGNTDDGTYPGGTTIPAYGFYLIVRTDASQGLKGIADAIGSRSEFTWTGSDYTLYLGTGAISGDDDPDIVDKVGFGSGATYYETSPALAIPEGKSIQRKVSESVDEDGVNGPGWDTDNNYNDFFIQSSPYPQNSEEPEPVAPVPEFASIALFAIGCCTMGGYILWRKRRARP